MKQIHQFATLLLLIVLLACGATTENGQVTDINAYPRIIDQAKKNNRYVILHSGVDSFYVSSSLVEKEKKDITVHLNRIDSVHNAKVRNAGGSPRKRTHIYMKDSVSYTLDEPHTIPINKIARITMTN